MKENDYQAGLPLRTDNDEPNIPALLGELRQCLHDVTDLIDAQIRDENIRYNKWAGQQDDGRLPDESDGKEAVPWGGASDVRIPLVDETVNDQVVIMKTIARKARAVLSPRQGPNFGAAGKMSIYLEYLRKTKLRRMINQVYQTLAQWRQTYGICLCSITWEQEYARDYQEITLEQLQQQAATNPQIATWVNLLTEPDPDVRKNLALQIQQLFPDAQIPEILRQLKALQETGEMRLPVRYLRLNQPRWNARKLWRDAFLPKNVTDEQKSPWIAERVCMTPVAAREKILSDNWPEDFVEAAVKQVGKTFVDEWRATDSSTQRRRIFRDSSERMEGLVEFVYFYYTALQDGVPCKYRTITCPHLAPEDQTGIDEPIGYDHGLYPHVLLVRERPEDAVVESRSVPQTIMTQQHEMKWMRDAAINQTDLVLQPPVIRPEREVGLPLTIRPRGEIGERKATLTRQMPIANTGPAATPLEQAARGDAERYYARNLAENPQRAQLYTEDLAAEWCDELTEIWTQTLQLAQQFETALTFTRTVGNAPVPIHLTRDDIQGEFDLEFTFNADQFDNARMEAKASIIQKVIGPMDRTGQIDWSPIVTGFMQYFVPELADLALRSPQQANDAELKDEQQNWALMMAGTEPEMVESGQNFALRLDWLKRQVQLPSSMQRLQTMPDSRNLVNRRIQHLEFAIQQQVNAQTGRQGVAPLRN